MATIAEAKIQFTAETTGFKKGLADIESTMSKFGAGLAASMKTAMVGIGVALGAAAAAGGTLAFLTKQSLDAGDELQKLSQRVGIGVELLSGYKLAAELAGLSLDDFGRGLQFLSRNMVEALTGSGKAAEAFATLGISVTDQQGKLKSTEQVMLELADRFAAMPDGALKTALALDLFGKSGAALIPFLNQGSAAIAAQRKEAELLGTTWTGSTAQMAEAINDNITRLQRSLTGFRDQVVQGILPFLNEAFSGLVASLEEWAATGQLQAWAISVSQAIVEGFALAAEGIAGAARLVGYLVDAFRVLMMVARLVESGFEKLIGTLLSGFSFVLDKVTDLAELLNLPNAQGLREMQQASEEWANTFHTAASQAGEAAFEWWESVGKGSAGAEKFAAGVDQVAVKFREWAEKTKAGATGTIAEIGKATEAAGKKASEGVGKTITEELEFMVDGQLRTLRVTREVTPALAQAGKKAEAVNEGTAAAAKSAETLTAKEATSTRRELGPFGEALAGTVEAGTLTAEQRGAAFGPGFEQALADLASIGREDLMQQLLQRFSPTGNLEDMFRLQAGEQGLPGTMWEGLDAGVKPIMDSAYDQLDEGLTRIEQRVEAGGTRIRTAFFGNLEQWFVDKLMRESARA